MKQFFLIALCLMLMLCVLTACRRGKVDETTTTTQETTMPTQTTILPTGNDPTNHATVAETLPSLMG